MCIDPVSLTTIATVTSMIGTGVSAYGAMQQGRAQANAAEYQQKQSLILADDARKRAAQKEEAQRRQTEALKGRQRALMAGSNLDLSTGSPLEVLADTAQLGELDARVIRGDGEREAASHYAQADLSGMAAKSYRQAGAINAFGTVLGGVSSVASKWGNTNFTSSQQLDPWNGMRAVR